MSVWPPMLAGAAPRWALVALLSAVVLGWSSRSAAQTAQPGTPAAKATASKEAKLPPAEEVNLVTGDGVLLKATYYPPTNGKESVPVILLHMYKGSRKDYTTKLGSKGATPMALFLQQQGHAVLVPDLRGHGDSTSIRGTTRKIEVKSMPPQAFGAMVTGDVEACKRFLMARNNEGQLNIEKLCLVGAEMGSVVAMDYARFDWSWPRLAIKQGQDVKAVVMISPQRVFRGLPMKPALSQPAILSRLAMMIVVGGEDKRAALEAKQLYNTLKRYHPNADSQKPADATLFYVPLPTSLQGTKMFEAPELHVPEMIANFIKMRLVDQAFPWKKRGTLP